MLYYHLRNNLDKKDGLLHYRKEPEYVIDFTEEYLKHADIYAQFKIHMDVQVVTGCSTTMNEVRSAVRQFLKGTKNTSFHETDLFMRFEEEFGVYRRTNVSINSFIYTNLADTVSEDSQPKKCKVDENSLVYYESVVIKNLKRTNNLEM